MKKIKVLSMFAMTFSLYASSGLINTQALNLDFGTASAEEMMDGPINLAGQINEDIQINGRTKLDNFETPKNIKIYGRTSAKNLTAKEKMEVYGRFDVEKSNINNLKVNGHTSAKGDNSRPDNGD